MFGFGVEKRLKLLEREKSSRACKRGDHKYEFIISPFFKCKHCSNSGRAEGVKITEEQDYV